MLFRNFRKKNQIKKYQLQGLKMIYEGLKVQQEMYEHRQTKSINNPEINNSIAQAEIKGAYHAVTYWLNECEKAINGNLHY